MSIEIRARIICDQCGAVLEGPVQTTTTGPLHLVGSYAEAKRQARAQRWLILQRYGKARHLCQPCADGKPILQLNPQTQATT